jgi:hypothetical protein
VARPAAGQAHQFDSVKHLRAGAFDHLADAATGPVQAAHHACATSSTHTGWKRASPPASGSTGATACRREQVEKAVVGTEDHRRPQQRQLQPGSLQHASPAALLRR